LSSNDDLNLLHIADLQFGDKAYSSEASLIENNIHRYFKENEIDIHLIAITGDIAYSGTSVEYAEANKWLKMFCKNILGENYENKILLVPGNHDVDLKLSSLNKYKFSFKTKGLEESMTENVNYNNFSLHQFKEFAYQLTQNEIWLKNIDGLSFLNRMFRNYGLIFYHLNTASIQDSNNPSLSGLTKEELGSLYTLPDGEDSLYKIILAHHGPQDFGWELSDSKDERWHLLRNFMESIAPNMYLHGHRHGFKTYPLPTEGNNTSRIWYHMTSTLSLDKSHRTSDNRRGFSIINFKRANGKVLEHKIQNYEIVEERIQKLNT